MNYVEILRERDSRGRTLFKTTRPISFDVGGRCESYVPRGFVSNLGTIPRGFYAIVAPSDFPLPFIHHDFNCGEVNDPRNIDNDPSNDVIHNSGMSRWMADAILYEHLTREGVPYWKKLVVWVAVRGCALAKGLK